MLGTRHSAKRSVRIRASETEITLITNNLENVGPLRKGLELFTGSNSMQVGVSMQEASFVVKLLYCNGRTRQCQMLDYFRARALRRCEPRERV